MTATQYFFQMFEALKPRTPWVGTPIDKDALFTLAEAAGMASKHAGEPISTGDILRAAGRGEITLKTILKDTAKVQAINPYILPAGAIVTLPLSACRSLANIGEASWRTFDGFKVIEEELMRFTESQLPPGAPDFETLPDDCRVTGHEVHALADVFKNV